MKILILEDNKFDSDLAKRNILKDIKDCQVEIVASIAEADKCININYDIALLDIKLPDGYGTDFLIKLRKINKKIAIIMLTGSGDEDFVVNALKSGADDYIIKKEGYLSNLSEIILYNLLKKTKRNQRHLDIINVLYLEHHATDIDLTISHFKKVAPQFHFHSIQRGEEALQLIDQRYAKNDPYDLLLMEYSLPDINAIELIKTIRQERKLEIPIVMVTGQGNEDIVIEALKLGVDEYLVKRKNYLNKLPYQLTNAHQRKILNNKRRELMDSESKYRLLFENNPQPMWIYDVENLKFLEVNKAAIKLYGYSKAEFLSMNLKDIRPQEDVEINLPKLHHNSHKNTYNTESRHVKRNGEIITVEISAHMINLDGKKARHALVKDITQRKKAEKQVQLLSASVEQSPISIVITNFEGVIEYVNPKFIEISGYHYDEVIGNNPRIISSGLQNKEFFKNLWDTIKSGHIWQGEFANKKKTGEIYWENAIIAPIKNADGEISHFVSVKEDISIKKKMIDELIISKDKAEESDRLKSAFLANMSHEIRTPMNGILGFTGLLRKPNLSEEQQQHFIEIIEASGDRMLNIINDIISISKIESGVIDVFISETNINNQLEFVYNSLKLDAEKKGLKLSFNCTLPEEEALINSDSEKFYGILINLVKNAIKYTDTGTIEFGYHKKGAFLEFYVKDSGIGIYKDRQEAIFERFIQADIEDKMAREGVGLGLSISKAYVDRLGGNIWLESKKGLGSTFYFTIPYSLEPKNTIALEDPDLEGRDESKIAKLKILIAEDDEASEILLTISVHPLAKETIIARTGTEAVEVCRNNADIDLVLMDIQMPDLNGYEATRQIRKFNKEVVIIAQTAFGLSGDRDKAIEAGCNDYFSKPFKKHKLLSLIQQYFKNQFNL